jgi:amidase
MQEYSIGDLQARLQSGELSSLLLIEMYEERIAQLDQQGPLLNSVIELNPDAATTAKALDDERQAGKLRGPLHGIPILIKDNIDTADKMTTTSGSLALEGSIAPRDAFLVERLREAGAVLLGKTNLSEWANFRSEHSSSGWSSRGGQTRNPYALDRNPCGSSSGSAVAVAANLCAAAVGTETDGSIVCPSQANGIVGIKPTLGLVSRSGVIPIAHSQDTAGPMARTVADAAIMLSALTGVDPRDPATEVSQAKTLLDYTSRLDRNGLKGSRIGFARAYCEFDWRVEKVMDECLQVMKDEGAVLVDPVELPDESKLGKTELEVLLYEFKSDLNSYLAALGSNALVHTLEEIIVFNEEHKSRVMPYFLQERMVKAQAKGPLTQKKYQRALERNLRISRMEGIDKALQENHLDAIVAPTGGPAWLIDLVTGDHYSGGGFSSLAAVAGYPHVTIPAGYIFGLPVGISFFASAWSEPTLIRLAYAFEQASLVRRPPQFLRTVDVSLDTAKQPIQAGISNRIRL